MKRYEKELNSEESELTSSTIKQTIGKNIRLARLSSNITQEQLAEKSGLSVRYISQLERGLAFGGPSTIISLCNSLNINADFLFNNLLTQSNTQISQELSNNSFIKYYLQLNDTNKQLIKILTEQLIKMQNNENEQIGNE